MAAVDGHALAVGVLAGLLADHPPASDLAALRAELTARRAPMPGSARCWSSTPAGWPSRTGICSPRCRCSPGRSRPTAVLAVAGHEAFGGRLAGWTPAMVQAAVRDRLGGLASWHPDGTISAHPLVRDTFRPLVLDAAEAAAETALAGLPGRAGDQPGGRAAGGRGHRTAAGRRPVAARRRPVQEPLRRRLEVWLSLPAARLGQRAATAFVATPARRDACAAHLGPRRLGFYLNEVGLSAMHAGTWPPPASTCPWPSATTVTLGTS